MIMEVPIKENEDPVAWSRWMKTVELNWKSDSSKYLLFIVCANGEHHHPHYCECNCEYNCINCKNYDEIYVTN